MNRWKFYYFIGQKRFVTDYLGEVPFSKLNRKQGPTYYTYHPNIGYHYEWYTNGILHNEFGPALLDNEYTLFYLYGILINEEEHLEYQQLSQEQKLIWKLTNV